MPNRLSHRQDLWSRLLLAAGSLCILAGVLYGALDYILRAPPEFSPAQQPEPESGPVPSVYDDPPGEVDQQEAWWRTQAGPVDQDRITKAYVLIREAVGLEDAGRDEAALERYLEALALYPAMVHIHEQLGPLYLRLGRYEEAESSLVLALKGAVDQGGLLNDLGVAFYHLGKMTEALEAFESLLAYDPGHETAALNAGLAALRLNRLDVARRHLEHFLVGQPDHAEALNELARIDLMEDRTEDGLARLVRVVEIEPGWATPRLEAAVAAARLGRTTNALDLLDGAASVAGPAAAYQVYLQPVFRDVRASAEGSRFEEVLAARARAVLDQSLAPPPRYDVREMMAAPPPP